ncbi:histidine kinase [Lactobacillus jensenii]|uniref:ATP-binding protein n=1 Tax=Lactobacillus jensenii TaxID=109790 RepID=UPI001F229FEF|nr:ATP-binding protein [Lactobacillus jensenii]MCF1851821.1 histidine kinase [Lactobacillus jensenii]
MKGSFKKLIAFRRVLVWLNLIAVLFNSSVFYLASVYIVQSNMSFEFLNKINFLPGAPLTIFWSSTLSYLLLAIVMTYRHYFKKDEEHNSRLLLIEFFLTILVFWNLRFTYNGVILLYFVDLFISLRNKEPSRQLNLWLGMAVFILVIFSLTDTVLIENISNIPQLDTYIEFLPLATKTTVILISNVLDVVNLIIFMGILVLYAIYLHNREYEIKEKLAKAAQTNLELKNYAAKVLIDLNPEKAKEQLTKVSQVVKQGLEGIRAALNKLRPGALENYTLQAALKKMLSEYSELSQMKFDFQYEWGSAEFEKTTEDVIFRIVEESVTNALRHGHASQVSIHFLVNKNYQILIKDNGSGCSKIKPGFGLTQMKERVAIIGGHIEFKSGDGFEIKVEIPKEGANHD